MHRKEQKGADWSNASVINHVSALLPTLTRCYLNILICEMEHTLALAPDSVTGTMAYIYATALPGDIVKLGRGSESVRARAAQTYYVENVQVLALWSTTDAPRDERRAQRACREWHVRGELYRVSVDWLETEHPLVSRVSRLLGTPIKVESRRRVAPRARVKAVRSAPTAGGVRRKLADGTWLCKRKHYGARWHSGNCMECARLGRLRRKRA